MSGIYGIYNAQKIKHSGDGGVNFTHLSWFAVRFEVIYAAAEVRKIRDSRGI